MTTFSSLWTKLRNKKFRRAFATTQLKQGVPFQINAMRVAFGWTQQELAKRSGLPQGTISRAENLNYGDLSFNTVLQIAEGFDVAFVGKFVPFSELARWYVDLPEQSFRLPTFTEEDAREAAIRRKPDAERVQIGGKHAPRLPIDADIVSPHHRHAA